MLDLRRESAAKFLQAKARLAMNADIREGLAARLQVLADEVGSVAELGRLTGIKARTMANYCTGDSEPQASALWLIAHTMSVSLVWLVTGRGPMRPAESVWNDTAASADGAVISPSAREAETDGIAGERVGRATAEGTDSRRPPPGFPDPPGEAWRTTASTATASDIAIPHYRGRGRPGTRATEPANIRCLFTLSQAFVEHELGVSEGGRLASVEHVGKAMEPTLHAGDIVLVDQARKDVDDAGLFCLERGAALVVRRCVPRPDGSIAVLADNRDFDETFTVDPTSRNCLRIFGRVVMALTKW